MLYIIHTSLLLIWLIYIIKKEKYSWHSILLAQFFFVIIVDIIESFFSYFLGYYKFNTFLSDNYRIVNAIGLIFTDGFILPFTGIILLHYTPRIKNPWILPFVFSAIFSLLDLIYLRLGYLTYYNWNEWISFFIYLVFSRIFVSLAPKILYYVPPLPYSIRIAAATYGLTIYSGAFISVFNLYQWTPLIVPNPGDADRVFSVSTSIILALISAVSIPKIKQKFSPIVFFSLSVLVITFFYYAHSQGWLVYHKWNHILTALYWIVSFFAIILYDRWECKYKTIHQNDDNN